MKKQPNEDKNISQSHQSTGGNNISLSKLNKSLAEAVVNNNIDEIKKVLALGAEINNTSGADYGYTPLAFACYRKNITIAKLLIDAGADVNKLGSNGETPLKMACDAYDAPPIDDIVELLLKHGADPDLFNKDSDGPLHYAAMYKQLGAVKLLVKYKANVNASGSYKRTPLIYAAADASSPEMVKFLIRNKANLKAKNESGENALFELITRENSNVQVAKILIDSGLDIHSKSNSYGTALHWAAFCGRTEIVKLLIQKGAKVNEKDKNGDTPIIKAMSQHKKSTVKALFELGADPLSKGQFGFSLLEYASETGDLTFVKQIVDKIKGASKNSLGALTKAAKQGDLKMLELLINAGFDVDDRHSLGDETPLMKAAYYGKLKAVGYLLEKGADIAATDFRGNTALLHAAWSGHTKVVEELLKHGAEINERNKLNWNALMQACVEGHFATAEFLLEKGSPVDEIDKEKGATALTLAKYNGSVKLIKLLESYEAKERQVKMRDKDQDYFSLFDCEICAYLPDRKDLGRTELVEEFNGLEIIFSEYTNPDRYCDVTRLIKKCTNCGTYYHQFQSIDTEDAFIAGPSISHTFQRFNLIRLKDTLKSLDKAEELAELEKRYPHIIEQLMFYLAKKPGQIIENHIGFVIESLTDYFILKNDWNGLKQNLLLHSKANIFLSCATDLVMMYGGTAWNGVFPNLTYYKSISKDFQAKFRAFFQPHIADFKKCVQKYESITDAKIANAYKSMMDSAIYYNLS